REHVADAAAALRDHPLIRDLATHVKRADEVVANHRGKPVRRDVLRRRRELSSRVVDQHIEPAPLREYRPYEVLDLCRLADVARTRRYILCTERFASGVELGLRSAADRDPGTEPNELARGSQ